MTLTAAIVEPSRRDDVRDASLAGVHGGGPSQEMLKESYVEDLIQTNYAIDTFYLLVMGVLVMFMACGFSMLETGMVRAKNAAEILTKNVALYAIACIMYLLIGYHIMYIGGPEPAASCRASGSCCRTRTPRKPSSRAVARPTTRCARTTSFRSYSWRHPCRSFPAPLRSA